MFYTEYQKYLNSITLAKNSYEKELHAPVSLKVQKNIDEALLKYEQVTYEFETWMSGELYKNLNLRNQYNQNIKNLENKIASIEQNIKNCSVYSPIDGEIDEIYPLNIGDYILSSTEIIRIVPKNDYSLKAEIIVDAAKIPRLKDCFWLLYIVS